MGAQFRSQPSNLPGRLVSRPDASWNYGHARPSWGRNSPSGFPACLRRTRRTAKNANLVEHSAPYLLLYRVTARPANFSWALKSVQHCGGCALGFLSFSKMLASGGREIFFRKNLCIELPPPLFGAKNFQNEFSSWY